ncbi:MAG: SDR family oxidoreductase [Candidatus Cloacimonetes bacterium]|nr:SDR family oxidoreductase [Candidatus Cloacimonadota bacterium]
MDLKIRGKVALVTAASKGLGKAVATALADDGAKVYICSRNRERIEAARDEIIRETCGEVIAFAFDITDEKAVAEAIDSIGKIDILYCNAGGPPTGLAENFVLQDYRDALELNLLSIVMLCNLTLPLMKQQHWGRIIINTSVSAKQPIDNLILSNTARSGVLGFMKSLSNEVAEFGITVNAVCPGFTQTERIKKLAEGFVKAGKGSISDFYNTIENQVPAKRLGTLEEYGSTVAFLSSVSAAYITGVSLPIDGGFIKGL